MYKVVIKKRPAMTQFARTLHDATLISHAISPASVLQPAAGPSPSPRVPPTIITKLPVLPSVYDQPSNIQVLLISRFDMDAFVKWFLIVCVLALLLYKYGTRNFGYWKKKGVKQAKTIPFFGNDLFGFPKKQDLLEKCGEFYMTFKGERFGGFYMGQKPLLSITDPDLLKQIMVKDAEYFFNRHDWSGSSDPLMSKNLVNLRDDNWRKMRAVMTTVFTSAKMKDMFGFMNKCASQSVDYLQEKVEKTGAGVYEMEWKEFFSRYGTDVIGSTAFGIEVDSFKNPENEFYMSGNALRDLMKGFMMLKMFFIMAFPKVASMLGLSFFGEKYNRYFTSLIETNIREREEKNIVRKDVIHILSEARKGKGVNENGEPIKGKLPDLTDLDIAAQAIVFFFGGFETIASLLGFISYELAVNPDVQETLQREIDDVFEKENGFTYDGIMHQMQYLNMVVNETLRKWPPAGMTDRAVTKTYTIPKTDKSPEVVLKRGDTIIVSIAGLHYDPEYFPNPKKFDPERFRDEKNTIKPFTYLPFGEGLRHCIGMRYALMEAKTIMVHLLKRYTFVPVKKTPIPMKLAKKGAFVLAPEDGFWLGIKPRDTV